MVKLGDDFIDAMFIGASPVVKIYKGADEYWPGSPLSGTNFLKYYYGNIKPNFLDTTVGATENDSLVVKEFVLMKEKDI